ncbi:MAG: site-specific integrase [Bacteriovoracaceae bacterium]|nr:site-specific integrase [Bacteriovoracaceae bacterium]
MAIIPYSKNGKRLYKVYIQSLGKIDKSLRIQRSKFNLETLKDARKEEKKLIKSVSQEMSNLEGRGLKWEDIIYRWEISAKQGLLDDKYNDIFLVRDHVNRLTRYTKLWFGRVGSDLTKGDGRQILNMAKANGVKKGVLLRIKSSVNVVFKWAIEERYILGVHSSPTEGLNVSDKVERLPPILKVTEIKKLLNSSFKLNHPWYPIWACAYFTGMRSGELKALQWKDIDLPKGIITVSKSYNKARKTIKCTKAGYWRTVPISSDLMGVLMSLKNKAKCEPDDFVLIRHTDWKQGTASRVLRLFLREIGVLAQDEVVFHTLRACFATHMLGAGVDQATVMKIGGWRDIKTFQIYIRLAGIEVKGATDVLSVLPKMNKMTDNNVINFGEYQKSIL